MELGTPFNLRPLAEQERIRAKAREREQRIVERRKEKMGYTGSYLNYDHRSIQQRLTKLEPNSVPDALEPVRALSLSERISYSYRRALLAASGEHRDNTDDCSLEIELSNAISKRLGRSTAGIYCPLELMPKSEERQFHSQRRSGLDTLSGSSGGFTVATAVGELIELLRNRLLVEKLGAQVLTGLSDTIAFPVQLTGSSAFWVSENPGVDVQESDATFGQRTMSPHIAMGSTSFSRKLLAQSTLSVEALIRDDLTKNHAVAIDAAAINGTGTQNQPLGLLGTTGINTVACGADGAIPSYINLVDLETKISLGNADAQRMSFATTPSMRGRLKQIQELPNVVGSPFVWRSEGGNNSLIGYPAFVSNNVPSTLVKGSSGAVCHAIILADWSQLYIGIFGVLEVLVDPFELKRQGMVVATTHSMTDVMVRQPAAFGAIVDGKIS